MVLGMTHEEAAVHLARDAAKSYAKYPFMIYQLQTKFRDEPRARGGLIRVREFTMKDAYSFHTNQADLEAYYARCYVAYECIFKRAGCKNVIAVLSDSGMMGGRFARIHASQPQSARTPSCSATNADLRQTSKPAPAWWITPRLRQPKRLPSYSTPEMATIEEVASYLKNRTMRPAKPWSISATRTIAMSSPLCAAILRYTKPNCATPSARRFTPP